jgi:peptidoglycan/xylan/chitin deacetylase (PgdA/CDA1 family)
MTVAVTTSWDDGHRLDPMLAKLLERHGLPGTFYIAPRNIEFAQGDHLGPHGIRDLAERFEIGGHTLSHHRLPRLGDSQAREEIRAGKQELEQTIGAPVISFCYPRGEYRPRHVAMVRECGFRTARTVKRHAIEPGDPFETRTTVNAYAHRVDMAVTIRMAGPHPLLAARLLRHWDDLAIAWFEVCLRRGGVFHLWGHSWEVEARGDWARLERVLEHISGRPDVLYLTNGQLVTTGA